MYKILVILIYASAMLGWIPITILSAYVLVLMHSKLITGNYYAQLGVTYPALTICIVRATTGVLVGQSMLEATIIFPEGYVEEAYFKIASNGLYLLLLGYVFCRYIILMVSEYRRIKNSHVQL